MLTLCFTYFGGLELLASLSSLTFSLVSLAVNIANYKLRDKTGANISSIFLVLFTIGTLLFYLTTHSLNGLL